MDEKLFSEVVSTLKYFKSRSLIIESLCSLPLSDEQLGKLAFRDKREDACYKIQYENQLCDRYSIDKAPTLYKLVLKNILEQKNLENCLAICCDYDFRYLKVAALFFLYLKKRDIKFAIAGVQLSMKHKFRKLALFGLSILSEEINNSEVEKMVNVVEKTFVKELNIHH